MILSTGTNNISFRSWDWRTCHWSQDLATDICSQLDLSRF